MNDMPYPLVLACFVAAFHLGGAIGAAIAGYQNRRKQSLIDSNARQRQLREWWIQDQCRIKPNMKYLYSGSILHKIEDWGEHEQYLARGNKEWMGRKPRVRHRPEKPIWR